MSYLVLARKYRPGRFEDLVGQEPVARTLTNAIALDRVHHAFLFTGARGVGKTSAARILAKALCCVQGPTATPCGTCDFCQEIGSGQSVDVLEIDGASNTGVDDVRTLREGVRYLPARGRKKVYIIDEVHMLSTSAFNALLKTLEEPPPHVVFIFATTEVHKIPGTIMSRCQRYDFKLISTTRLAEHLARILSTEGISFEAEALRLVARQAAGSVRDSLSLIDQIIAYAGDQPITRDLVSGVLGVADRRMLFALADAVLQKDSGGALRLMAQAVDRGIDLGQLARSFLGHLHDVEIVGLVPDPSDLVDATADEIAEAKAQATRAPRGLLGALFDRWARAVDEAAKSQTPRLLLEMALVDLCFAEPLVPLGDLLERLESLEKRLGGGGGGRTTAPARSAIVASTSPVAKEARAPAAPVPVAPAPRAPAPAISSPEEAWRIVCESFGDRPSVAAALDHAAIGEWAPGRVTLLFGDRFTLERAEKHRADIERALGGVCGQPTKLVVKEGEAATSAPVMSSEVTRAAARVADEKNRRDTEARQHPMVRKAQELFGANIREVKTP